MATHVVVREFRGPTGPLAPGAEVDASAWRNTERLVRQRYLRPVERPVTMIPTPASIDERGIVQRARGGRRKEA